MRCSLVYIKLTNFRRDRTNNLAGRGACANDTDTLALETTL